MDLPNALPTKEAEIGGHTFQLTALGSKRGDETLVRLMNLLGPAMGEALGGLRSAEGGDEIDPAALGRALARLFASVSLSELDALRSTFFEVTSIQKDAGWVRLVKLPLMEREALFACNYSLLIGILRENILFNYASFLAGVGGIIRPG